MPPDCGSSPSVSPAPWDMWGTRADSCWICPTCPRAPVWFMHTLPTAPAALFASWCFISHSLFSFKPSYGAGCGCLVPVCAQSWPGSPLGFQMRWDSEVSMLLLLLSCVTVEALTHNSSANHPGSVWRPISCICVFNCPVQCILTPPVRDGIQHSQFHRSCCQGSRRDLQAANANAGRCFY